jgi:branched-chain amino acid transport system substrate-binding protein
MKTRMSFLALVLLSIAALTGCESAEERANAQATEIAAEVFATQTAQAPTITPTPTPSPTPTDTAIPTPTPTPTFTPTATPSSTPAPTETPTPLPPPPTSGVVLTLEDLPPGFEEMPETMLGNIGELLGGQDLQVEGVYAFLNLEALEVVMGFTVAVPERLDQAGFDVLAGNPELLATFVGAGMGGAEEPEFEELTGLDGIGDTAVGVTMLVEGQGMLADMVLFRTGELGFMLFVMYAEDSEPQVSVIELAQVLDDRAQAVSQAPTTPSSPAEAYPCDDPGGCAHVPAGEPIRLGTMLVLSGPNATLGLDTQRGIELAVEDRGEVLGHAIELAGEDSQCQAEGGQTAAAKLAADPAVVAVIGPSCSSVARVALPILCEAKIPLISPSNTAVELTLEDRPPEYGCYLRVSPNDRAQGTLAAQFVWEELEAASAATIHDGSPYADQLAQAFAAEFERLGGTITGQAVIQPFETDVQPVLATLAADEPEVLYYPIFATTGGLLTGQARETAGLEDTALISTDTLFNSTFLDEAGDAAVGVYLTSITDSGFAAGYQDFADRYEAEFGEPTLAPFHAHGYDAAMLILAAIEQVAVQDEDGTLHIGRQALLDALFATREFKGLAGSLTCDAYGDCAAPQHAVYQVVVSDPDSWNPGGEADSNPRRVWP